MAGNINEMNNLKKDLEKNLDSIGHWMDQIRLKLNPDKTELISFGGRAQLKRGIITSIEVGDATVNASTDVKYLGAHLDQTLDFKETSYDEDMNSQIQSQQNKKHLEISNQRGSRDCHVRASNVPPGL